MFLSKRGQGTIEYLVILVIIVVISLIVVSLLINSTNSSQEISSMTTQISSSTVPIAILDTAITEDGNYYFKLKNNTGDNLTISTITLGEEDAHPNKKMFQNNEEIFIITSETICQNGQQITNKITITYLTSQGLTKTQTYPIPINFECTNYTPNKIYTDQDGNTYYPDGTPTNPPVFNGCSLNQFEHNEVCYDECVENVAGGLYFSGEGTEENPYQICNWKQLANIESNLDKSFVLITDLNEDTSDYADYASLSANGGLGWNPIGSYETPFSGNFNGDRKNLSGLRINAPMYYYTPTGLFEYANNAKIENVNITNFNFFTRDGGTGALVGRASGNTIIKNNYAEGTIATEYYGSGAIVGYATGNTIVLSNHSNSNLSAWAYFGGIVGYAMDNAKILNNYTEGTLSGIESGKGSGVGGIVGWVMDDAEIKYNYSKATINASDRGGGIAGMTDRYAITQNNFAVGTISGATEKVNGFIGHDTFSDGISNNYWDTYLTGKSNCYYWGTCTPGCYDSNSGCLSTHNQPQLYHGSSGIPFTVLGFDSNWTAQANNYPILTWELE